MKKITPDSTDYFYLTSNYLTLPGHEFKHYRKKINFFEKQYRFEVTDHYPAEKTKIFLREWYEINLSKKDPSHRGTFDSEYQSALKAIDLLSEIPTAKALYVLIDGVLAGYAIYEPLYEDFWVSIYEKVNHEYQGISHWLFREKAKRMRRYKFFTNGDDAMDPTLARHKEELRPFRKEQYFLVETGESKMKI